LIVAVALSFIYSSIKIVVYLSKGMQLLSPKICPKAQFAGMYIFLRNSFIYYSKKWTKKPINKIKNKVTVGLVPNGTGLNQKLAVS
jgi:hypothetical protein